MADVFDRALALLKMDSLDRVEDQIIFYVFAGVGLAVSPILLQLIQGIDLTSVMVPYILALVLGAGVSIMYFIGESGRTIKEFYRAKFSLTNKQYRYGLALRADGNGNMEAARLKKHDRTAHYFIDPKTKNPVILDRAKTDFAVQKHSLDGVDVVLVNASDAVPAVLTEARAAAQVLEIVYECQIEELPLYETDVQGHLVMENGKPRLVGYRERYKPTYPEMYKIPLANLRHISDMVFEAENREQLYMFALDSVVMEKEDYNIPMDVVPEMDQEGKPILGEDGKPRGYLTITGVDEQGKLAARPSSPGEVDEFLHGRRPKRRASPTEVEVIRREMANDLVKEAIAIRLRLMSTNVNSGRCLLNVLYSLVIRPWLGGEMENIRQQAVSQLNEQNKEAEKIRQNNRTNNQTILLIGAGVATAIVLVGLWYTGALA